MSSPNPILDTNDPRLTAYVLGELAPTEAAEIEATLQSSPELRAAVADIRRATETIGNVFMAEPSLHLTPEQKSELLTEAGANFDVHSTAANVTPAVTGEPYRPTSTSSGRWLKIAVAAGLTGVMAGGAYYFSKPDHSTLASSERPAIAADSPGAALIASNESELNTTSPSADKEGIAAQSKDVLADTLAIASPSSSHVKPAIIDNVPIAGELKMSSAMDSRPAPPRAAAYTQIENLDVPKIASKDSPKEAAPSDPSDRSKEFAKNDLPENVPATVGQVIKRKSSPKLTTLELAQRSLDQSVLGSLNLKVIPQAATQSLKQEPVDTPSSAIFKLHISDQDANRIVRLLSNRVDPQQQRSLSFDDLISVQKTPSIAATRNAATDDLAPRKGSSIPPQATTAMLAMKLRLITGQSPMKRDRNQAGATTLARGDESDAGNTITMPLDKLAAKREPGKSQAFAAESADLKSQSEEFNFDYSQVIQQLRTNLELRNQSVLRSEQ